MLGIFTKRAHGRGVIVGLIASGIIQYLVKEFTSIHVLLYALTGIISCVFVGYAASIIIPAKKKAIDGLTIYTIGKAKNS